MHLLEITSPPVAPEGSTFAAVVQITCGTSTRKAIRRASMVVGRVSVAVLIVRGGRASAGVAIASEQEGTSREVYVLRYVVDGRGS